MEILKIIESVDLANEKSVTACAEPLLTWLDENVPLWRSKVPRGAYGLIPEPRRELFPELVFLFSRDALKNIRPEGYACEITLWNKGIKAVCIKPDGDTVFNHPESLPFFKTEELAELHAIIQAIEFERMKNDGF